MDLQEQVRVEAARQGVNAYAIAHGAGISEATAGRFLYGGRNLRGDTLGKVCEFLNLEIRPRRDTGDHG